MRQIGAWLVGARPYALLVALCLLLYLPGLAAIPPLDRDEARFAQASRQMLETGDLLRIRFQDEARNKKPAGIYWLQAAAVAAFSTPASTAIWPYRLPSLLGAMAAVLLVFGLGTALFSSEEEAAAARRIAFFAALLLGIALGTIIEAHVAKTDAALLAAVVAGQGALGLVYVRARTGRPAMPAGAALFWVAETAAILLKGPPGPALAIVTIAALSIADRDLRWLRGLYPLPGVIFMIIAIAPWVIAIERATEGAFLVEAIGHDLAFKLIGPQEAHGAPPFSYLLMAMATFWPGSLLLVPALARGWRRHEMPAERFLLAWLVPAWAILELVPTKLPHYVLPLYPALALLAAVTLVEGAQLAQVGWVRYADIVARGLWAIVTVVLAAVLIVLPLRFGGQISIAGIIGAVLLLGLAAALLYGWPRPQLAGTAMAALSVAFLLPAAAVVLPGLDRFWLSRAAADLVARHPPQAGGSLVAVGYAEPSLVFLLGGQVRLTTPRGAAEALAGGGAALVSNREEALFRQALSARGLVARPLGSAPGFAYANGQRIVLTLYDVAPG
ncbi:MAG TPA: glycosyl transferase [Stellaceae bacterium]|nr:glycosyl transferase [Stellaceae bacterium]